MDSAEPTVREVASEAMVEILTMELFKSAGENVEEIPEWKKKRKSKFRFFAGITGI